MRSSYPSIRASWCLFRPHFLPAQLKHQQDMENEIWKDVKGYEGLYQISNIGRVKSIRPLKPSNDNTDRQNDHILTLVKPGRARYFYVCLSKDGKSSTERVHRLVAKPFIPNPYNLPCVNHKDENPLNNRVHNLEWCTQLYNTRYGTAKKKCSRAWDEQINGKSRAVYAYTKSGELVGRFDSVWDAVEILKIGGKSPRGVRCRIRECCNGKRKAEKGYVWCYECDVEENNCIDKEAAFIVSLRDLLLSHNATISAKDAITVCVNGDTYDFGHTLSATSIYLPKTD